MLTSLLDATAKLEKTAKDLERDTVLGAVGFEVQSKTGRKGEPAVQTGALRKISFPSKGQAPFANLRRDPELLATLSELGLENPKCLVDQVNLKLPRIGTGFPFHQDTYFVVGATKGRIERHGGMNLIIALDPADASNGGFEVLGRTHHTEVKDFTYDLATMNEGVFDESRREVCALQPGDGVIFHPLLAHGSGPNRSDSRRRIVTMWFRGGGPQR